MKRALLIILAVAALALSACAPKPRKIYIAEQFGTAYAPVALMRELGILDKCLPEGVTAEWSQLGNTAAIREAMLAGKADIGFMAIPPFLIGRDGGMQWRICAGLSRMPMGLVAKDASIRSIADIGPQARIALPQPGSIQHILLAMAAERELGEAGRFDNQLVTLSHPDGMSALLAGTEVGLHFTTAPYLHQELSAGMQLVLSGEEAMGEPFTGIVAVAREGFGEQEEALYRAFLLALEEAISTLNGDPAAAAKTLAPVYGMSEADVLRELTAEGAGYGLEVQGLSRFSDFLFKAGYIKRPYDAASLVTQDVTLQ